MKKREVIIDGNNFNNLEEFYFEIDRVLTKDLSWKTGHTLDALNDILSGGFGLHDYGEAITIIWKHSDKSKEDLGYNETVRYYQNVLRVCHQTNRKAMEVSMNKAILGEGETLFYKIIGIIKNHKDIELILE